MELNENDKFENNEDYQKLLQENERLQSENSTLKSQFEKTFSISESLEDLSKKNSKHLESINKLKEEKEDLLHRLQINIQSQDENKKSFEEKLDNMQMSYEKKIQQLNKIQDEKDNEYSESIKQKNDTIRSLEQKFQSTEGKLNKIQNENTEIYHSLTKYFNSEINNLDDLIIFLKQPKVEESEIKKETLEISSPHDDFSSEIQIYQETISKLKLKSKKDKKNYEQTIKTQEKTIETLKKDFKEKAEETSSKIEELTNKIERQASQIKELNQSKESIIQENARLKTQNQCIINEFETKQSNESFNHNEKIRELTIQLNQTENSNDKIKKQIPILLNQLRFFKNSATESNERISELESSIDSITAENNTNVQQIFLLKKEIESKEKTISEITDKNNQLSIQLKSYVNMLKEKNVENSKLTTAFEHSTVEIEAQKNEFADLKNERDKLLDSVSQNESKIASLETKLNESLIQNKKLENELNIAQKKLVVSSEPINEASLLPLTAWSVGTFPDDLSEMITKISDNQTLQTPSKLKHIFSIIMEWYQKKDERINSDLESMKQKIFDMETNEKIFVNYLSDIFEKDYSSILKDEKMQKEIESYIMNLKNEIKKLESKNQNFETEVIDFLVFMNSDNLNDSKEKVGKLNRKIEKMKNNSESQKAKFAELLKECKSKEKELQSIISKKQKENEKLKSEFENSQKVIQTLYSEISTIQSKSEEQSEISERRIHDASVEFDAKVAEFERQNSLLSEKVQEMTQLREKSEESKVQLKTEITQLQKTIQHLTQKNDKKNQDIQKVKDAYEEKIRRFHDVIESDRQIFKQKENRYKALIDKMIKESKEENLKKQNRMNLLENENESLKAQNDDLSIQIHALNMKCKTIEADFDRQKRLLESQMKTDLLTKEVNFTSQIEESKKKLNQAKLNMMGLIASQFCALFDTNEKLDESNFEIFVRNIGRKMEELMKLEWKLRELLKLGPLQSIEDAVSSLLLKNVNSF